MVSYPNLNSIGDVVRRTVARSPDRIAIVSGEARFTYVAFNERVNRLANVMKNGGVTKGTAIACLSRNRNELLETLVAANKIGAVYVPLNYRLAADELRYIIENSEAKVLVFDPTFIDTIRVVRSKVEGLKRVISMNGGPEEFDQFEFLVNSGDASEPDVRVSREDLIWIAYTSGTTGFPKGVMSTNGQILAGCRDIPVEFGSAYGSSVLCAPPLCGAGALTVPMQMLYCGGKMALIDFDPVGCLKMIEKERIEIWPGVPVMAKKMMEVPDFKNYDLSSLRHFLVAGGHLHIPLIKELRKSFPGKFQGDYALTEIGGGNGTILTDSDLNTDGPPETLHRITSAGRPRKGVDVRIVNEQGKDVEIGGEIGEILIKSPGVMKGYWKNPEATAKTLKDGYVCTGDMGWIDEEGYIFIVDRKNDTIRTGSSNVYPAEVEQVLQKHPAVDEVAVFATPDSQWGEAVTAVVVLKTGMEASPEDLMGFCQDKIAGYKKPKKIIYSIKPLPRNGLGKVLRKDLRSRYS